MGAAKRAAPPLSEKELEKIRGRRLSPVEFHNVLLAQADREKLLAQVDYLSNQLHEAEAEKARLRRSIS